MKPSLVCSNSTVFLRISSLYVSQHGEVISPMNLRDAYMHHGPGSSLIQVMAWCMLGAKPLPEPILIYNQLYPEEQIAVILVKMYKLYLKKWIWK